MNPRLQDERQWINSKLGMDAPGRNFLKGSTPFKGQVFGWAFPGFHFITKVLMLQC